MAGRREEADGSNNVVSQDAQHPIAHGNILPFANFRSFFPSKVALAAMHNPDKSPPPA
jgi:hypothetical protein